MNNVVFVLPATPRLAALMKNTKELMHCHWHQQQSTIVDIHGPLQTRGETNCPGGVSVSCFKVLKLDWLHISTLLETLFRLPFFALAYVSNVDTSSMFTLPNNREAFAREEIGHSEQGRALVFRC